MMTVNLEHFALITHAVPAERVRRLLPPEAELETTWSFDGTELALVSVGCFFNKGFRPLFLPYPSFDFEQATFRTYIRHRGRRAVYFFATYIEGEIPYLAQKAYCKTAYRGAFHVRRMFSGLSYSSYNCSMHGPHGVMSFKISAGSRESGGLAPFLTERPHGLFQSPFGGAVLDQKVSHPRMQPLGGEMTEGRFDLWAQLRVLREEEARSRLVSVLVQPSVRFVFFPPWPASLMPGRLLPEPAPLVDFSQVARIGV